MPYLLLKNLHAAAAVATIAGFVLRGYWMIMRSDKLQHRVTRIAPHVLDTFFLLSGVAMLLLLSLNPLSQSWLLAKFAGLILYIMLGSIAIRRGRTLRMRIIAFIAALLVFCYIAGVALSKSTSSWLSYLA